MYWYTGDGTYVYFLYDHSGELTDHYLVNVKVRERLSVRKQAAQKTDVEKFNLKKSSELEIRLKTQTGFKRWRT